MATIDKSIECDCPVSTCYNQWTQFESFPSFMEGIKEVRQLDDTRLHWRAEVAGKEEEWDAKITEQVPDRVISWVSTSGRENNGTVRFTELGTDRCRIDVEMSYDPHGIVETVGDKLGFADHRVEGDLKRFRDLVEDRGAATGGYRGEVRDGETTGGTQL